MLTLDESPQWLKASTAVPVPRRASVGELAERRLRASSYLALRNVWCEYRSGVLTLHGWLPTYYLKQVAQTVVSQAEGVQGIVNLIKVLAPGPKGRVPATGRDPGRNRSFRESR